MKLQFDANQTFQLDAVAAVVDLFEGQPQDGGSDFTPIRLSDLGDLFTGQERSELGLGNRLLLAPERLESNLREIQARNDIEVVAGAAPEGWELFDAPANKSRLCPHFSVEMETGTGKTYVYLRTVFELSRRYGFRKFVIVVPSVAIREGVLKNLEITAEHFRALFGNAPSEHFVYDARRINRLRQFAMTNTLQILVINIDAFRKNFTGTEAEQKSNVIYKESDRLSGRQPIEFVQAARPIVIIDEPQSVDSTDRAQEAIKALNPLCTLRYSATHRNPYNLVYRLDPVRAFELKLVKQIIVAGSRAEGGANDAFVRVEAIDNKKGLRARLRLHVQTAKGPKEKALYVTHGADLHAVSNERAAYREGFSVTGISAEPGNEHVRFSSGRTLRVGEQIGGLRAEVWRVQIRETVQRHLEQELRVQGRGIKVLSLFFIDRVANYRDYGAGGEPVPGKFAEAFEQALGELKQDERYRGIGWLAEPVARLHNGYFAQDKKGALKDTAGNTLADDDVYNLIMKDKERLLSLDEPLRFVFSHSALREGWDNPNVFQICTLNESQSAVRKRQEIGRGLRLPVDQMGARVFDESINKLHVMANESYEDFARALQSEYEEECGVTFGKVPLMALARLTRVVGEAEVAIGPAGAEAVRQALIAQKMLDTTGKLLPAFDPRRPDFKLELPTEYRDLTAGVVDLLSSYQIERHIRRARDEGQNRLRKEVQLSPEFQALWDRIKPRTTYRVEFETDTLVSRAVYAIQAMPKIEAPKIHTATGRLHVSKAGVEPTALSVSEQMVDLRPSAMPDILAYLQNETELTRATLVRILRESSRLAEIFADPQRFLDAVVTILRNELHRLLVDGIKYERLPEGTPDAAWEMLLFKDPELINYLTALKVQHSIYEYVPYDSQIEREFARRLDEREDIKLFVKLPSWFRIETPVGQYNPDWAILKHDGQTLYLVRETKGTRDFLKLRNSEADKVRCGQRHFDALGLELKVAVTADEV
ncbi:MAG: DEAD/DEAH box helicase family protein [Vicinamibacteria bacterium]|nr:DEAD/DEAH box helicase family protein [Vicinamibacteria bacterium]